MTAKNIKESSSSFSFTRRWKYDVFLSHRSSDTLGNFVDHLYTALVGAGIHTFRDDEDDEGEEFSVRLNAIENSRISIMILSRNYVSSRWCLDQLVRILECKQKIGQMVLPIFYDVDPSDVRKQTGSLAEPFARHEEGFKEIERVKRWRQALTEAANLAGWDLRDLAETQVSRFIQNIVEEVLEKLLNIALKMIVHQERFKMEMQRSEKVMRGLAASLAALASSVWLNFPDIGKGHDESKFNYSIVRKVMEKLIYMELKVSIKTGHRLEYLNLLPSVRSDYLGFLKIHFLGILGKIIIPKDAYNFYRSGGSSHLGKKEGFEIQKKKNYGYYKDILRDWLQTLVDLLNSPGFKKIRHILGETEEVRVGNVNPISSPLVHSGLTHVLKKLEMALLSILPALRYVLHEEIFSCTGYLRYLNLCDCFSNIRDRLLYLKDGVSWSGLLNQPPLQADRKQVLDSVIFIYESLLEISNSSEQLEAIAKEIRDEFSQEMDEASKLKMEEKPPYNSAAYFPVEDYDAQVKFMYKEPRGSSIHKKGPITGVDESFHSLPKHLKKCFLYTSLFPKSYEFDRDTLVQLWMALGFILPNIEMKKHSFRLMGENERPEEIGSEYFEELLSRSLFQELSMGYPNNQSKYKVNDNVYDVLLKCSQPEYARAENGKPIDIPLKTSHFSLLLGAYTDPTMFKALYRAEKMLSLLLLNDYRNGIMQVPQDLFLKLRFLRVLDLSRTDIMEFPTSIGNLNDLHYLDLSDSPIRKLPESVSSLHKLQTLKLRNCSDLVSLPHEMNKLINLRHLYLDGARQLRAMPRRIGELTNLQTLSTFIVGIESGSPIHELKDMRELRGSLRIVNMENITYSLKAKESILRLSPHLCKIEFQWNSLKDSAEEVLEHIQPHTNIEELKIVCYGGVGFPSWLEMESSSFLQLKTISLSNCRKCACLPPLGQLPFLVSLCIEEMHAIKQIDYHFCGYGVVKGFQRLETLELDGMRSLRQWTGIEEGDMHCLRKLVISDCPKLVSLPMLSLINSLQILEITLCPKLPSFPEEGLPKLQSLIITECPILEERCRKEEGKEWHKIAVIPDIWIHYQQISGTSTTEQSTGEEENDDDDQENPMFGEGWD